MDIYGPKILIMEVSIYFFAYKSLGIRPGCFFETTIPSCRWLVSILVSPGHLGSCEEMHLSRLLMNLFGGFFDLIFVSYYKYVFFFDIFVVTHGPC